MTIRQILVPTMGPESTGSALETAFLMCRLFGAHAEALFIKPEARHILPASAGGLTPAIANEMSAAFRKEQQKAERLTRQKFDDLLAAYRLDYRENTLPAPIPSASWSSAGGAPRDEIVARGAACDLLVVGRPTAEIVSRPMIETALFETGRPVLVAPPGTPERLGENVLIGWNRSALAARAVLTAMPVLECAGRVTLMSVTTGAKQGPSAQAMARYLAWHEIQAEVRDVAPGQRPVGEALLSEAAGLGCDLIVMGAYSRGRFRELLLGGVTRHMLDSANIPVLMAH